MGTVDGEVVPQEPSSGCVGGGGGEEKVVVMVRLRPLSSKEVARNDISEWECVNDNTIIHKNNLSGPERSMYPSAYTYDRVFRSDCSTRQVYDEGAKEVALSVVSGLNASIFAYGQTSSGKTYTMSGITEYAVADIYGYIDRHSERAFVLKLSAMEIYNESVKDLLCVDSSPLRLLDDPERGTVVERLTEETLRDRSHLQDLLAICDAQRQIGETSLNETSSRSHQILRLTIESSDREYLGNTSSTLTATVNFVDLAGSERASQTLSAGTRLKEGCHINRSLLTLGTVIRKLSKGRNGHVPFRDSKLTRILQSSLGGNSRTCIICTVSPARSHVEQSRNTLLFGSCAKEVTTNAQVNIVVSDKALVKHLQREVARLESELRSSWPNSINSGSAALLRERENEIEKLKEEITELVLQRDSAQSQVEDILGELALQHDRAQSQVDNLVQELAFERESGQSQVDDLLQELALERDHAQSQVDDLQRELALERDRAQSQVDDLQRELALQQDRAQSQIDDLLRVLENNKSSTWAQFDKKDPSQQVERQGEYEHSISNVGSLDVGVKQLCTTSCGSGYSQSSCDENYLQLPMRKDNFVPNDALSQQSISTPKPVKSDCYRDQGHFEEQLDEDSEEFCKEVQCIEVECLSMNKNAVNTSFDEENAAVAALTGGERAQMELLPRQVEENFELNCIHPACFAPPQERDARILEKGLLSSEYTKLGRSRSCNARLISQTCLVNLGHENTPPNKYEREFTGRPKGSQFELPVLHFGADVEKLSISRSQTSVSSAGPEDLSDQDVKVLISQNNKINDGGLISGLEEMTLLQSDKQQGNCTEKEPVLSIPIKNVKDVGVDPIQGDLGSLSSWPAEFKRLQRDIIKLWNDCNVSLIHRTFFFLIFKGDQADSIYMEVELRRLSFLHDIFSQGSKTVEDGRPLTPALRKRALYREREMLSKQMQKRLSAQDREDLYLKWGIGLKTKHRRLQLAYRLWTDTEDMEHIADSAVLVARLVGLGEQGQALKEMFGLNFTPQRIRKFYSWKSSVLYNL